MYQLNYRSIAKPELETEDLENILETAIAANSASDISGCLIYHEGNFVQILEGKKQDVLNIFEKIKGDERHHSVTLLWENKVDGRYFSEWNMAYYRPEDTSQRLFVNNLILLSELSDRSSGTLLSFWGTVRRILRGDPSSQFKNV